MTVDNLKNIFQEYGIAGAGGAGFPSYAKLNEKADTIILNCAECEPLLKVHREVLKNYTYEIMCGLTMLSEAMGNAKCIIAIKPSYKTTVQAVKDQLSAFPNIEIRYLPEIYPAGDEVVTIYEATGRIVPPGSIPISVGCIVYNVETVLNIYRAVSENAPVTHKYVTITGEVNKTVTLCVPIGTSFSTLIKLAGGTTTDDFSIINGGPMTGTIATTSDVVTKTTNALIILPKNHPVVVSKQTKMSIGAKRVMASCCQCRSCTELCSRNLLGHPIEPHEIMRAMSSGKVANPQAIINAAYCSGCGICELYACPQGLHPRSIIAELKAALRQNKIQLPKIEEAPTANSKRNYKLVSKHRLTSRLGLAKYNKPAKLDKTDVVTDTVKIMFSQHLGAPATPVVKKGDMVSSGQKIAVAKSDALSLNIHSSISGKVIQICDQYAVIKGGTTK